MRPLRTSRRWMVVARSPALAGRPTHFITAHGTQSGCVTKSACGSCTMASSASTCLVRSGRWNAKMGDSVERADTPSPLLADTAARCFHQTRSVLSRQRRTLFFLRRRVPPRGEEVPCRHEAWLLYLAERLLAEYLVVFRDAGPLTQERQQRLRYMPDIFKVELS